MTVMYNIVIHIIYKSRLVISFFWCHYTPSVYDQTAL